MYCINSARNDNGDWCHNRESWRTGKTIRAVATERRIVPDSVLDSIPNLTSMAGQVPNNNEFVANSDPRSCSTYNLKQSNSSARVARLINDPTTSQQHTPGDDESSNVNGPIPDASIDRSLADWFDDPGNDGFNLWITRCDHFTPR
jgi:hypothetical protein